MPLGAFKAALMGTAGVSTGDVVLLSSQTASNSATLDFTSGITSTYGEYIFKFYNINPATDAAEFMFQGNVAGESGYNETITSTFFYAVHSEDNTTAVGGPSYHAAHDQAQGTAFQHLAYDIGNGGDESCAGELHLFNPSSTTYVKHFYSRLSNYYNDSGEKNPFVAGYFNVTGAIDDIQFKMSSGNFDGKIKMWGVK